MARPPGMPSLRVTRSTPDLDEETQMHPFASVLVGRDIAQEARRRADAETRAMYARPDALPLPPEPGSVGIRGRISAVVRRVTANPAPG